MKNCIVVGGGLCGLFSAIILADKFEQVTIIESEEKCGGLLRSVQDDQGIFYDQGTHLPNTTLIPEVDHILFGDEQDREKNWHNLGRLKTANLFQDKMNLTSEFIDIRNLDAQDYEKIIVELLSRSEESTASDIVSYLTETHGPTFVQKVAIPLFKKLYGQQLDENSLVTNSSVSYFGLSRIIALTPLVTNKLKELPTFDAKLAYHNQQDYIKRVKKDDIKEATFYYPKQEGGVEYWIKHLIKQAKAKGVIFKTKESISQMSQVKDKITSVTLTNSQETLACDFLFWSAPPVFALKMLGHQVAKATLQFRTANVFHFTFDKPLLNSESYYLWNWNLSAKSFRVTLFPNMKDPSANQQNSNKVYNLTIEALSGKDDAETITEQGMLKELTQMGLIAEGAKVVSKLRQTIHNTFPVPDVEFTRATKENYDNLTKHYSNIMVSGRFSGKYWFHNDIIKAAYYDINARFPK